MRLMHVVVALLFVVGAPLVISAQERESQRALAQLAPFLGRWTAELPEGELVCDWELIHNGTVVRSQCWPPGRGAVGEPGVIDLLMWHPGEDRIVFRRFEYQNPDDLMFDGWYRVVSRTELEREYLGYYGDGSIGFYRQTYTLDGNTRMTVETYAMSRRRWDRIFDPLTYVREPEPAPAGPAR